MITILIIYLIGVIFAYGSVNASYYSIWQDCIETMPEKYSKYRNVLDYPEKSDISFTIICVSWIGFFIDKGLPTDNKREFLRFKNWQ